MIEPTYSLPVTLFGAHSSGHGVFADQFSGSAAKAILALEHGAVTSTDGGGRSMSIWPPADCPDCDGSGEILYRDFGGDPVNDYAKPCKACAGTGRLT